MRTKINQDIILKIIIIFFIFIFIFFLFKPKALYKSLSPNQENRIVIQNSEAFLFGNQTIYIKSSKNGLRSLFSSVNYTTSIANDGKNLSEDNIDVSWVNDSLAIITLTGEEQNPEKISVIFDDAIYYK